MESCEVFQKVGEGRSLGRTVIETHALRVYIVVFVDVEIWVEGSLVDNI